MINKVLNTDFFRESKRRFLNLKGIASGRYAYKGPDVVQIDLTDKCNSNCLTCWIHSPLKINYDNVNYDELDFSKLKSFIQDTGKSGTKEIIFSGGGEPFYYSNIWEVLEFTQKIGITFRINTNFTLLNKEDIQRLLSFDKLASLTISIWSGDENIYSRLHDRDAEIFHRSKSNIMLLNRLKQANVKTKIYSVINNLNYFDLQSIIDFAGETGCDYIEFGVTDIMPKVTDSFLLNKEQLLSLKKKLLEVVKYLKINKSKLKFVNNNIFIKRISNLRAHLGEYDTLIDKIPCYSGWTFLRLRANGDFNSCLKSHKIPLGNIYNEDLSSIWNNSLQQEFRNKSLVVPKDKEYFKLMGNCDGVEIGCHRLCDNMLVNEHIHKIIKYLFCSKY